MQEKLENQFSWLASCLEASQESAPPVLSPMICISCLWQGYRDRYDIIDHGHEKTTFMCFFHRSIFTEIREFANHCFMEVSYKLWL